MHCKSLWIKASAKCINVNDAREHLMLSDVHHHLLYYTHNFAISFSVVQRGIFLNLRIIFWQKAAKINRELELEAPNADFQEAAKKAEQVLLRFSPS